MPIPRHMSISQVCRKLRCAKSTIRKLIANGSLRATRIGDRTIRISEQDLELYLASQAISTGSDDAAREENFEVDHAM